MVSQTSVSSGGLELRCLSHPAAPTVSVLIFADSGRAVDHLCDHVLTNPESDAWVIVMPGYEEILDPNDPDQRWHYAETAQATRGASSQCLYDLYCVAVAADVSDAACLNWLNSRGSVTVTLGTSGILVVINRTAFGSHVVKTAMLPGQGTPQAVRDAEALPGPHRSLARESVASQPRFRVRNRPREERARRQRDAGFTREQRLYYHVFKPAVQFIRTRYHAQFDMLGRPCGDDYALLKEVLPRRSRLKYADWLAYRTTCGRH